VVTTDNRTELWKLTGGSDLVKGRKKILQERFERAVTQIPVGKGGRTGVREESGGSSSAGEQHGGQGLELSPMERGWGVRRDRSQGKGGWRRGKRKGMGRETGDAEGREWVGVVGRACRSLGEGCVS